MKFFFAYVVLIKSLMKATFQLVRGVWKISKLPQPIVTIFGGSRVAQESEYARQAHELAHMLVRDDISVITGGGPGIMRAVNCGAVPEMQEKIKARNIGISVEGLSAQEMHNECAQEIIVMDYFWSRKWLMINYSVAFVFFPGGFGTLDEMTEVATLMQTKKLPGVPIVLIGVAYWQPFIDWLEKTVLAQGLITQDEFKLLYVTDDLYKAHQQLKQRCVDCKVCVHELEG